MATKYPSSWPVCQDRWWYYSCLQIWNYCIHLITHLSPHRTISNTGIRSFFILCPCVIVSVLLSVSFFCMPVHTNPLTPVQRCSYATLDLNVLCDVFLFLFSFFSPSLHPSLPSPSRFLKQKNCCSAGVSQLQISLPNFLIKNCVSGPIQALKAPLNGFSCRVPSLENTLTHHTHTHTLMQRFDPIAEKFLFFKVHTQISVSLSQSYLLTASVNMLLLDD